MFPQTTKLLNNREGAVVAVLEGMKTRSWVHLTCYTFPHAELAFLSVRQTASGDKQLPEEAVHLLAAGMLIVGYNI
jgi:hypothetical protein